MGRHATPLSPEAEAELAVAIRREYHELRERGTRAFVDSPLNRRALAKRRRLVEVSKQLLGLQRPLAVAAIEHAIARFDAIRRELPDRPPHAPGAYPHFTAAALRLMARRVSLTMLARIGVRYLPGLPDEPPGDLETMLKARLRQAARRQRRTKPRP